MLIVLKPKNVEEIQREFPAKWVLLTHDKRDENGKLVSAVVIEVKDELSQLYTSARKRSSAFCWRTDRVPPKSVKVVLKIATCNLDYRSSEDIRARMAEINSDIWVMTETLPDISPGTKYRRVACSPSHGCRGDKPEGRFVTIWVSDRILNDDWAVESQDMLPIHEQRSVCVRLFKPGNREVIVVGTVFPYPNDPLYGSSDVGYCAALASQSQEWKHFLHSNEEAALCVVGDFNQTLPFQRFYPSKNRVAAVERTLGSMGLRCLSGYENDPRLSVDGKPSIDHIFVSGGLRRIKPLECWTMSKDHAGVCAELMLD